MSIDKKIIEEIQEVTKTDYEIDNYEDITTDQAEAIIIDLLSEVHALQEKYDEREQEIEDNYRRISVVEQYDVSEHELY